MCQQRTDFWVAELVPDDSPIALRADSTRRPQQAQGLRHRRVVETRRDGQIRHADRSGMGDGHEKRQTARVAEQREARRPPFKVSVRSDGTDRAAHSFAFQDVPIGWNQVHTAILPEHLINC